MKIKKRKSLIIGCSILILGLIVGAILINLYLNYRLEGVLRVKLSERVSEVSGGFYKFKSNNLHFGLLSGAITLSGIELYIDSVAYKQRKAKDSLPENYFNIHIKQIRFKKFNPIWLFNYKKIHLSLIEIKIPVVKIYNSDSVHQFKKKSSGPNSTSLFEIISPYIEAIKVKKMNLENVSIVYISGVDKGYKENTTNEAELPGLKAHFETKRINIRNIELGNDIFNLKSFEISKPVLKVHQIFQKEHATTSSSDKQDIYKMLGKLAKKIYINQFNISDANIEYSSTFNKKLNTQEQPSTSSFFFTGMVLNNEKKTLEIDDFNFSIKNLHYPINNGLYTLKADAIDLKKKLGSLKIEKLHLVSNYPKTEFAYNHPNHKDWYDVEAGHISLSAIDFDRYFSATIFNANKLVIKNAKLLNFKNQKIKIEHNIMPMVYEGLQKMPLKFDIDSADIRNLNIVYEELPNKGTRSGVIFFSQMNGKLLGLTNIVSRPKQYIQLNANGKFMGTGYFTATWMLPVDSLNDHFHLEVHLRKFDLRDLNQLITPLLTSKIKSGVVNSLTFSTDASSKRAEIEMSLLYNNLEVTILRNKNEEITTKTLISTIANNVLKNNNPDSMDKEPRTVHATLERDPYHSTFNYLLQILKPALIKSVGIFQEKQSFAKKIKNFGQKMKDIFHEDKKEPEKEIPQEDKLNP